MVLNTDERVLFGTLGTVPRAAAGNEGDGDVTATSGTGISSRQNI